MKIWVAGEDTLPSDLFADSDAPAAHDAEVVVAIEEGLPQDRHISEDVLVTNPLKADELHRSLQLASPIAGAELASHRHRKLLHTLTELGAFVLSIAEKTGGGMVGEGEEHLQGVSSHLLQLFSPGLDDHTLLREGVAGGGIVVKPLYRDDAELAGAYGLQVRVIAKCRHIRSRLAGRIENGGPRGDRNLSTIDDKSDLSHVPNRAGDC